MKKYLISSALMSVLTVGQAMAACPYSLDATASDYTAIGLTPFPSINLTMQDGSYAVSTTSTTRAALSHALATTGVGDATVPSSGIFAFENYLVNFPSTTPQNGGMLNAGLTALLNSSTENIQLSAYLISASILSPNTSLNVVVYNPATAQIDSQSYPVSLPISSSFRVGFYVNQSSKQIGVIVDGVDKGYLSFTFQNTIQKIGFQPFSFSNSSIHSSDAVIGQTVKTRLVTDAAQVGLTYPSGAKDICGNTI